VLGRSGVRRSPDHAESRIVEVEPESAERRPADGYSNHCRHPNVFLLPPAPCEPSSQPASSPLLCTVIRQLYLVKLKILALVCEHSVIILTTIPLIILSTIAGFFSGRGTRYIYIRSIPSNALHEHIDGAPRQRSHKPLPNRGRRELTGTSHTESLHVCIRAQPHSLPCLPAPVVILLPCRTSFLVVNTSYPSRTLSHNAILDRSRPPLYDHLRHLAYSHPHAIAKHTRHLTTTFLPRRQPAFPWVLQDQLLGILEVVPSSPPPAGLLKKWYGWKAIMARR
jgi:hypothetical protein